MPCWLSGTAGDVHHNLMVEGGGEKGKALAGLFTNFPIGVAWWTNSFASSLSC